VQYLPRPACGGLEESGKDVEVALNAACPMRAAHNCPTAGCGTDFIESKETMRVCLPRTVQAGVITARPLHPNRGRNLPKLSVDERQLLGGANLIAHELLVPRGGDSAAFFESAHSQRAAEASNPLLCGSRLTIRDENQFIPERASLAIFLEWQFAWELAENVTAFGVPVVALRLRKVVVRLNSN